MSTQTRWIIGIDGGHRCLPDCEDIVSRLGLIWYAYDTLPATPIVDLDEYPVTLQVENWREYEPDKVPTNEAVTVRMIRETHGRFQNTPLLEFQVNRTNLATKPGLVYVEKEEKSCIQ